MQIRKRSRRVYLYEGQRLGLTSDSGSQQSHSRLAGVDSSPFVCFLPGGNPEMKMKLTVRLPWSWDGGCVSAIKNGGSALLKRIWPEKRNKCVKEKAASLEKRP